MKERQKTTERKIISHANEVIKLLKTNLRRKERQNY